MRILPSLSLARLFVLAVYINVFLAGCGNRGESERYFTAPVTRGVVSSTIQATGTVEPEDVIDVGARIAGQIISFGADENGKVIDYGSQVKEGTVLATLDDSLYAAEVAQAEAGLARAKATVEQANARHAQAVRDWTRAQRLAPTNALSESSIDAARAAFETSKADILAAHAEVAEAQAQLLRAQRNLSYCIVVSPVDGVIIDRRVNIGQTVVASLNAPSLFLIAKDLKRMEVLAAVNEADIGRVKQGQTVAFSVDAFPDEVFQGQVNKIRLNATMTQNIVTYTVEISADNSSGKLLPYLTASVRFQIEERANVLSVPNSALRWVPSDSPPAQPRKEKGVADVWILQDGKPAAVPVRLGLSDGMRTEVSADALTEAAAVIVGEKDEKDGRQQSSSNPFAPAPFRGRTRQ